jgi:YebC/PmpR family DNA-binding regulatory protein
MGRAFEYRKASKFKRWGQMAKTFSRIGKQIAIAVKAAGGDPDSNSLLRGIIQNAKAANMPKDNIDRAIKNAMGKDTESYAEVVFEGYAQHGVAILVECATNNNNRTVANVRSYFNKTGGTLGTSGMLDFIFERKSIFKIANNTSINLEELEFELIDLGVDEVFLDEETNEINIWGAFTSYGAIQKFIESNNYELRGADFDRIPNDWKELTDEQIVDVEKLIEKLEEDDDVQNVFHNMK